MPSADLPTASVIDSKPDAAPTTPVDMDALVASLKSLEAADLFKVMKQALAEAEKRTKGSSSKGKGSTTGTAGKRAGSSPKGVVPPQLKKPRAWVDFTQAHALKNGWESFTVFQTKKNKVTGEKEDEEIEMPASVLHDGAHVYDGSVTEKNPAGKQLIHKDAMSLSKQRWAPKEKSGSHDELYAEFVESYVEDVVEVSDAASVASSKKVTKVTAAEKAASVELKKAEKEVEKAAKKAEKDAEKEVKKAEKEAEKEAKKAEKEAEKEVKKAEKEAEKKPTSKSPVPAAAVKKPTSKSPVPAAAVKKAAAPVSAASRIAAVAKKAAAPVKIIKNPLHPLPHKAEEWTCPSDGMVHPWAYKGKNYLRNSENETWLRGEDGGCGEWQGIYLVKENRIDDSVPEPEFEDDA